MEKYILLLFVFAQSSLIAQIPADYELLDHTANIGFTGAYKVLNDKVVYVSHNRTWPMTEVKIADFNNNVDTLYTSGFSSQSILLERNGETQIILYSLIDYDIGAPGFIVIDLTDNDIQVNSYFTDWDLDNFNNNYFPYNFNQDSTGALFTIEPYPVDSLSFYKDGIEIRKHGLPSGINNSYSSNQGDIFLYNQYEVYHFDGIGVEAAFISQDRIIDIKSSDDTNLILFQGRVDQFNKDFSELLQSWTIPESVISFYQIQLKDDLFIYAISEDDSHKVFYNDQGIETVKVFANYTSEVLHGIDIMDDDQIIIYGISRLEPVPNNLFYSLTSNPFFRSYSAVEQDYEREDVDLDEVNLTLIEIDTFDTVIDFSTGDSIYLTKTNYDLEVKITNNKNHLVEHLDIYIQPFDIFSFFNNFLMKLDQPLQPLESRVLTNGLTIYYTDKSEFKFALPGANYRFNESQNKVKTSVLTVSTEDIEYANFLKIYPNPTSQIINVESEQAISNISVYNMNGQLLKMVSSLDIINTIDVSDFSEGTYILRVVEKSTGKSVFSKFVKI